jgi:hypothetical protein
MFYGGFTMIELEFPYDTEKDKKARESERKVIDILEKANCV